VIASGATSDKNRLDTGTLGWNDIRNKADYSVESSSASMSSSGNTTSQFMGNMANGMLAGLNNDGSAASTTGSAVADGTIVIRDKEKQTQDVAELSRDTDNAHSTLAPIFDAAKEQQRIDENRAIAQIGSQVADIVRTEGKIAAQEAAKNPDNLAAAKAALEAEGKTPTGEDIARRAYDTALNDYGTGSDKQKAVQAVTAAIQGLTGGDWSSAVAGAAAPYMAEYIKTHTAEGAQRIISHALAGAVVADMQGGNAAAGAAGAGLSAAGAKYIAEALYPGKDIKDLSEEEKQGVVALATLASGIAGGVVGGDVSSGIDGAKGGKNKVENNALSVPDNKARAQEMTQCQGSAACENTVIDKYKKINAEQHESVVGCKGAQDCVNKANEVGQLQADYARRTSELLEKARSDGGLSPAEQNELSVLQVTTIQLEADRNAAIHNALMSGDSSEAKQLAINSLAQVAGTSAAGIAAGIGKSGAKETSATGQSSTIVPGGGLAAHEKAGGHLIDRHVGKTEAELFDRVSTGNTKTASTFTDRATAEAVTSKAIDSNQSKIQSYLSGSQKGYLELDYQSSAAIGISVTRGSRNVVPTTNARIIIGRDPSMPDGYKIITGYPTP
jgi:filamentous hemagglutinin